MHDTIVVLDFGSQYAQLIARCIREENVFCELLPWNTPAEGVLALNPKGYILSGGPASVYSSRAPQVPEYVFQSQVPILGVCYGMQALTHSLGGEVAPSAKQEYGHAALQVERSNPLLPIGTYQAWMSHGDRIERLPEGFTILAHTDNSPIAAMGDPSQNYYGVQFHPEVRHTNKGKDILAQFVIQICGAEPDWTPYSIINESVQKIRDRVGKERVLSAVSGGVDSSVATALVHKAVGDQLHAVFVDTGMLREGEAEQVITTFRDHIGVQLHPVHAVEAFLSDLKGITDPEKKRALIGNRFIRIFEEQAQALEMPKYLVQGTIYPDVVESRGHDRSQVARIKTHHNVGGLPEEMDFELIEPLRYLFKDEVRRIGISLGLPPRIVWRQPFPGPGLAIRVIGEVTWERLERLRAADAIFLDELREADLLRLKTRSDDSLSRKGPRGTAQAFAVLLPVQSVGVMGDKRTYQDVIALRAVTTDDFMTADWARLPQDLLAKIGSRIVNEVEGINRVVYDITSKPPGTIEWE
ncbi:MAG: glutamine-hydrolyzing GMP synthase [Anaerolineales bacterium]